MKDLVHIFSKPVQLVLDVHSGTPSIAKMCLFLEGYRLFVGFPKIFDWLQKSMQNLVEV